MKYSFELKKNIHMYNHLLICSDGQNRYETICESAPTPEKTIIFWPDELGLTPEERRIFAEELEQWSATQGFRCIFYEGRGR